MFDNMTLLQYKKADRLIYSSRFKNIVINHCRDMSKSLQIDFFVKTNLRKASMGDLSSVYTAKVIYFQP